MLQNT